MYMHCASVFVESLAGMSKLMPGSSDEEREAAASAEIPVGRMGRKWDIAMGVLYLASPAAGALSRRLHASWASHTALAVCPMDLQVRGVGHHKTC